jgi:alpha-ribazole phosphatase
MDELPITKVWLIRHGEPCESSRGRCYGKLDVELSENGREQIHGVAEFLRDQQIHAIYASPRKRTTESARIVSAGRNCTVRVEERFSEIDFGDFEGRSYDEIAAIYPAVYRQWMEHPTETQFPNGESFEQMRQRVLQAFREILALHRGKNIALLSHGGVNRIVLADALGVLSANIFRIAQDYAAINLLHYIGDYPLTRHINLCVQRATT